MKILDLGVPPIRTFLVDAFPLTVMSAYGNDYLDWFYSNFIQIKCYKEIENSLDNIGFMYYDSIGYRSPYIELQTVHQTNLRDLNIHMHDFICKNIDSEGYVEIYLDDFYVPQRNTYLKFHFFHSSLIYGYDRENQLYYTLSYNDKGEYSPSLVSFKQFEIAYDASQEFVTKSSWSDRIYIFNYADYDYKFNKDLVKLSLKDYLNSTNQFDIYRREYNRSIECVFGIATYGKLLSYLKILKSENIMLDYRVFYFIYEHKKIMFDRLCYMQTNKLSDANFVYDYQLIVDLSHTLHRNALKYFVSNNKNALDHMYELISQIYESEVIFLNKYIKTI